MTTSTSAIKGRPVAVLGGGVLGRRIACTWAAGGWDVDIRDPSLEQRNAALHYVENKIPESNPTTTAPGKVSAYEPLADAVKNAWTVVEAVPEKLSLKIDTFADLEKLAPKDAILVSNSSSYKSSEMLDKIGADTKKRVMNTHYMMPPTNRIVELMTDGHTNGELFPFYADRLKEAGMHPITAKKESTGFVFNRVWAAIKRECLMILSDGVSDAEQLGNVFKEMFHAPSGPCAMMDGVGLDTVAFIEEHYIKERGYPREGTVDFLKREFIDKGKLGAKSRKGSLLPPGATTKAAGEQKSLRIMRCNLDGSEHEIIIKNGDFNKAEDTADKMKWNVGISINQKEGKFYWTQKGTSKGSQGGIFRANLDMPKGQDGSNRTDIKLLLANLPEPIDEEIDEDTQTLLWTDRGDPPTGNSLNSIKLEGLKSIKDGEQSPKYDILTRQLHEAIGLKLDQVNKHVFLTDLGGTVYRVGLDGKDKKKVYDEELAFSGIGLAYV